MISIDFLYFIKKTYIQDNSIRISQNVQCLKAIKNLFYKRGSNKVDSDGRPLFNVL